MPTWTELVDTYFTDAPAPYGNSTITPLIDTDRKVNEGKGDFVYIHGWWLGLMGGAVLPGPYLSTGYPLWELTNRTLPPFPVVMGTTPRYLIEVLVELAQAGVDVRVLGWCHSAVLRSPHGRMLVETVRRSNVMTIESLRPLRAHPDIGWRAALNVVHHAGGAAHAKLVVVGNKNVAIGFTGGIDLVADRLAAVGHPGAQMWHDVAVRVDGPAVQGLYDWFKDVWHDATTYDGKPRPQTTFRTSLGEFRSTLLNAVPVPDLTFAIPTSDDHHVQSLRTLPAAKYKTLSFAPSPLPTNGPAAGEFKLRDAWQKAIAGATRYVYMEDQAFESTEVLGWVNARIKAVPDLRVILVTGASGDPNDPATDMHAYLCQSLNGSLLDGLDAAQRARVRMFRRWGDDTLVGDIVVTTVSPGPGATTHLDTNAKTEVPEGALAGKYAFVQQGGVIGEVVHNDAADGSTPLRLRVKTPNPPDAFTPGPAALRMVSGLLVHAKTTIVDDNWAMIGSANCMRRSLYTDVEHSIAFVDEAGAVKEYRKALWAHHFRTHDPTEWDDLDAALHSWEPSWFAAGASPLRPPRIGTPGPEWIEPLPLPLPNCGPLTFYQQHVYDTLLDVDSRDPWGFLIPPMP